MARAKGPPKPNPYVTINVTPETKAEVHQYAKKTGKTIYRAAEDLIRMGANTLKNFGQI
jgi:hypothetical protein